MTYSVILLCFKTVFLVKVGRRGKTNPFPALVDCVKVIFQTASEIRKILGFYSIRVARCMMKTNVTLLF